MVLQNSKTTRLRVGLHSADNLRSHDRDDVVLQLDGAHQLPAGDEESYWADAIQDGSKFYYRVNGITVEIDEDEYYKLIGNPRLYYFSTALKLHFKIRQAQ